MLLPWLVTLFTILNGTKCAKILAIFPFPSLSHQVVFQPIWKELSLRGHQVTVLTPNPLNDSNLTNLTEIDASSTYEIFERNNIPENLSVEKYPIAIYLWIFNYMEELIKENLDIGEPLFKNPKTEFDLIITEAHFTLAYSLGCRFKVPIIAISSMGILYQIHDAVGNPSHPLIGPDIITSFKGELTFYTKVVNTLQYLWYRIIYYWYIRPRSDKLAKEIWGECPSIGDLEKKIALVFINTNPVLHPVRAKVPSVFEMRQLHITPRKKLPKDLQKYLDKSTQGVVYFSLGTNVKGIDVSSNTRRIIRDALSELPYNVLWKWENDSLPDKPDNVMIMKWFPQQDVLAHKNIKVFITQGGLQSIEEAINNTVPMVGVPLIADQQVNVKKIVSIGLGKSVNIMEITKDSFKQTVLDVAKNEKYKKQVTKVKNVLFDESVDNLDKAIWWIEYVLRHKGAKYLRSPAADLSWLDYYLAHVAILPLFALLTFIYFVILCFKYICFRICCKITKQN